jgi:nucleotide-binding universal stress UspA family protein
MATRAIISYDDTLNDHDALALGRLLATVGAELLLAYVRHTVQSEPGREELEDHEARALLARGARWLGDLDAARRVVVSASTGEGLAWLAEQEPAELIVFGSDYRTPPGHVSPQRSAQQILEGGPAGVAIAPANFRTWRDYEIANVGVLAGMGDDAALITARELADRFAAKVTCGDPGADLLVVGSRPEAAPGRVMVTAHAHNAIESARAPVIVVPRAVPLHFPEAVGAA